MVIHPIIFGRAHPTHIAEAATAVSFASESLDERWRTFTLDGKWDVVSIPREQRIGIQAHKFIQVHRSLAINSAHQLADHGIERLETHLLAKEIPEEGLPTKGDAPTSRAVATCSCVTAMTQTVDLLPLRDGELQLPQALVVSMRNVLNLFRAAALDQINCCEITPALRSCVIGLNRLLRRYSNLSQRLDSISKIDTKDASRGPSWWYSFVVRARQDLADWCTYAERVVSQRTVGRFEEFLAQNERVVSYRGGIQKLLYLADALMNSYAARVLDPGNPPAFMSLFDPIDIVLAMRIGGFVRVPVRYLFVLPLSITHLWHEVGVFQFYAKYEQPFDTRTASRLRASAQKTSEHAPQREKNIDLMLDVADSYGDAVTLTYGFGGDLNRFILSFATAQFEQSDFRLAPSSQKQKYLSYLLTRLYIVLEYRQTVEEIREKTRAEPIRFSRSDIREHDPHPTYVALALRAIIDVIATELLAYPRYADISIDEATIDRALQNIGRSVDAVHRAYINDLAFEIATHPTASSPDVDAAFSQITEGAIVRLTPGPEIDAIFLRMQYEMIASLRNKQGDSVGDNLPATENFFCSISALVRSSILAFYQQADDERGAPRTDRSLAELWRSTPPTGEIPDLTL
jgi:hypothetical protein